MTEALSMQPTDQGADRAANAGDNRAAFWSEMRRIAEKGTEDPGSLTREEIGSICRLALVGMTVRQTRGTAPQLPAAAAPA